MKRGSGGAAGRKGRGDVAPGNPRVAPTTGDEGRERAALADLEAQDEKVRRAAESLERRLHDLALVQELRAADFAGPGWLRFVDELARYGHAVLVAWMRNRSIAAECARRSWPIGELPMSWTDDDHTDLATDAVVAGIELFRRKALVEGGWTFEGGAGLKTFFVGAAVLSFPTVYRRWCRQREEQSQLRWFGNTLEMEGLLAYKDDPGEVLALQHAIRDGLAELRSEQTRKVVVLDAQGYSYAEIAELLATTTGAVAQTLYRHRASVNGRDRT